MKKNIIPLTVALLLALLFIFPVVGWSDTVLTPEQVQSQFKSVTATDNSVFVQGRWKRTGGNKTYSKPPLINTVAITCDKKSMTCRETIAELLTPQEISGFEKPQLFIDENTYQILDWTDDIIRSVYLSPVADFELIISIKDDAAERSWRETKARGNETSDPENYENWTLE